MPLHKLTQSGEVRVLRQWARPGVYENWLPLLDAADYQNIVAAINAFVGNSNVVRAQYVVCAPGQGSQWKPVYAPVWDAMNGDWELAAKFIGLILWEVMYNRLEDW